MISIIVPIYNAAAYLRECIDSILNQIYYDIEVILVNDGSQDESLEICKRYKDNRIVIVDKPNGGVSSARNVGIDIAKGEYICFVDSDDTLPVNAIQILLDAIQKNGSDAVVGPCNYQYGEKLQYHAIRLSPGEYLYKDLLPDFFDDGTLSGFLIGSVCAALYNSKVIKTNNIKFADGLKNNEDGLFNFEFALHAKKVTAISVPVYNYRQEGTSTIAIRKTERFGDKVFDILETLDWDRAKYQYDIQKQRRKVTLAWWQILHFYDNFKILDSISFIRNILTQKDVRDGLKYMCPARMGLYKKFFYYLIYYRLSICICLTLRYIVPAMKSRLKH